MSKTALCSLSYFKEESADAVDYGVGAVACLLTLQFLKQSSK